MPFTSFVLDKHIAPGVSAFTEAVIPDMSRHAKESKHWIGNFFLNSTFRSAYRPPLQAYVYNYLRRAKAAFSEHELARAATLQFLESEGQSPNEYANAIFHWEVYLGQSWHAFALLKKAFNLPNWFTPGDRSLAERLNHFYNTMKHVESKIENDQMLPEATVPVWLGNDGLLSIETKLTFAETGEILFDIAQWADALSDPTTVQERLRAMESNLDRARGPAL